MRNIAHKQRMSRYLMYVAAANKFNGKGAPKNPFKEARTSLNLTQEQVAEACGITKQALIRLEQGIPDKPIESVSQFFERRNSFWDWQHWQSSYEYYQNEMRCHNTNIFGKTLPAIEVLIADRSEHPLRILMDRYWCYPDGSPVGGKMNPTELSKLLCVNQSIIDHFLNKPQRQQSVPRPLTEALQMNGYNAYDLNSLVEAYQIYRTFVVTGERLAIKSTHSIKNVIKEELTTNG